MRFLRQEYWSGLPFPLPVDLPNTGMKPMSPAWQADSLPLSHLGSPILNTGLSHCSGSSVLAWRIPGTAEPGGLPSLGSLRVRHDWSDLAVAVAVDNMTWVMWITSLNFSEVLEIILGKGKKTGMKCSSCHLSPGLCVRGDILSSWGVITSSPS